MTEKVKSILEFNNDIRDEMLKRNIGKYSQYDGIMNPAIGEYYRIDYDRQLKDLKGGKNLLEFTQDEKSDYSIDINRKYFANGKREKDIYNTRDYSIGEYNPFVSFQSGSYIQYIDEVLGTDEVMRHVNYINNFLSGRYIENALRQTEVDVITPDVSAALQGLITNNPNNMNNTNTLLGRISNYMYANVLYNGAIFNSDRNNAKIRAGENYYQKQYITPYLVNKYGNNLANVYELGTMFKIGTNETMIREDIGADVHVLEGKDITPDNVNMLYITNQYSNAERLLAELRGKNQSKIGSVFYSFNSPYVDWVKDTYDWRYTNSFTKDIDNDVDFIGQQSSTGGRYYAPYMLPIQDEGDSIAGGGRINNEKDEFNTFNELNTAQANNDKPISLLEKTTKLFNEHKINTLIGRFHTGDDIPKEPEFTDTAKSSFGNSHGRNLLVLDANSKNPQTNGYSNPYCRTWTYHHQYNQVKKLIRPFVLEVDETRSRPYTMKEIQSMNSKYRAYRNDNGKALSGIDSLATNTVLQDNGFVRITPKIKASSVYGSKEYLKNCMFSIENLAWRDVLDHEDNLSAEQRGPNGGRVMWFPPYDLDFQEGVTVDWQQNTFIGRGEKVYTYTNTERTGTLSFSILIDHPAIINSAVHSEGLGAEKDPEADILRFFAGCNMLGEDEKSEETESNEKSVPKEKIQPVSKNINFKIYFPNNFSGILTNKSAKELYRYNNFNEFGGNSGATEDVIKDYWWQYILVGNDTCLSTGTSEFRGYEMNPSSGITTTDDINKGIPTCKDNKYSVGVPNPSCIIDKNPDTSATYHYQIDEDLHQILNNVQSYNDNSSEQFNAVLKTESDTDFTFAELVMALLIASPNQTKYKPLYDTYSDYVFNTCGVSKDRVDKLANEIFKNESVKITNLSFLGSADGNDKSNAKMLADRRAMVTTDLIVRLLNINKNEIVINNDGETGSATGLANNTNTKSDRYCQFTLTYTVPESVKQSDTINSNVTEKAEESSDELDFNGYLNLLCENSEVINEYNNILMLNKSFRKQLENRFNQNPDLKNLKVEGNDYTALNSEIFEVVYNYVNVEALVIAYTVNDLNGFIQSFSMRFGTLCYKLNELIGIDIPDFSDTTDWFEGYFTGLNNKFEDYDGESQLITYNKFPLLINNFENNGTQRQSGADKDEYEFTYNLKKLTYDYILGLLMKFSMDGITTVSPLEFNDVSYDVLNEFYKNGIYNDLYYAAVNLVSNYSEYSDDEIIEKYNFINSVTFNNLTLVDSRLRAIQEEVQQTLEQERKANEEAKADAELARERVFAVDRVDGKMPNTRYENEAEYFGTLEHTDPLLFRSLTQKFKYFNPAYHSLSPEGFNARLTFLHQCTRQGQTQELRKANNYVGTASNLAFGRMPVCVIRIGDFIHTRAIIQNMTIQYGSASGIMWDLNSEGAGVQPMYAKISLGITLLGGQSLGAPITRLQNAISFNYYANTEVYDNRADVAHYQAREKGDKRLDNVYYDRIWTPLADNPIYEKNDKGEYVTDDKGNYKVIGNTKDEFNKYHSQDGVWKDLTTEQKNTIFNNNENS